MGGNVFEETRRLDDNDYNNITNLILNSDLQEGIDYLFLFRLSNKFSNKFGSNSYGDYDLIVSDTKKLVKLFNDNDLVLETKIIDLYKDRIDVYSEHILTKNLHQIDLLKSWVPESIEITRIFYSYSFANIFINRLILIASKHLKHDFKFSALGIFCYSRKFVIPEGVKYVNIDEKLRLIIDCNFLFNMLDLNYDTFKIGFKNEIKLLEFFEKSKYYKEIKFKNNSKFRRDCSRLKPFKNLFDLGLIKIYD